MQKSGLQRVAAKLGLAIVAPDTSPRKTGIEGVNTSWDFGDGKKKSLDRPYFLNF